MAEYENKIKDLQVQVQLSDKRGKNTEAIIYSIRDAVIVIDEYDKLLMANEAAGRLFNFNFNHPQHLPIRKLIGQDHREFLDFIKHSKQSKGQATRQEMEFIKDGIPRKAEIIPTTRESPKEAPLITSTGKLSKKEKINLYLSITFSGTENFSISIFLTASKALKEEFLASLSNKILLLRLNKPETKTLPEAFFNITFILERKAFPLNIETKLTSFSYVSEK